jgi:anti-anti-sigma factor
VVSSATPEDPPFSVEVRRCGRAHVVTVAGEVDLATVDMVRDAVAAVSGPGVRVVVDLAGTRFAGTCLGSALVAARRRQEAWGGTFRVVNIPPAVWRLLHAAQFAAELGIGVAPARHGVASTRPGPAPGRPGSDSGSGRWAAHALSPPSPPRIPSGR